jgi:cob(I)alamin adenosyltransferase
VAKFRGNPGAVLTVVDRLHASHDDTGLACVCQRMRPDSRLFATMNRWAGLAGWGQRCEGAALARDGCVKIYTRKGDEGQTGIWGGVRLAKDEARIEAIGSVDELNAAIGFAAAALQEANRFDDGDPVPGLLGSVQQDLLVTGTELMAPSREGSGKALPRLADGDVARLEAAIDDLTARLPELRNFIVPGGTEAAARLHLARAVCRRAERRLTTLRRNEAVSPNVFAYLNRLSDLLFVLARYVSHVAGADDIIWAPRT